MIVSSRQRSPVHNAFEQTLGWQLAAGLGHLPAILNDGPPISFADLVTRCGRMGNGLKAAGIRPSQTVALVMADGPALVAAYLAVIKIGAVALALDIRSTPIEIAHAVADSGGVALLTDAVCATLCRTAMAVSSHPPPIIAVDDPAFTASVADTSETWPVLPGDAAFMIYTSGTTGAAKAVLHRHGDVAIGHLHLTQNLGVGPGERVYNVARLSFAYALGHGLFGALKCGAAMVLTEDWPDAGRVAGVVRRHEPTVFFGIPAIYRDLLRSGAAADPAFRAVRHFVSAAERLPDALFSDWVQATGRPILDGVGNSEVLFLIVANTPSAYRMGTSGRPQPWARVKLVASDGSAVTAPGQTGVLWVKMKSVAAGYWNRSDETEGVFRRGWFRTGDIFSVDKDGWWRHHGRDDDMLKIAGQWVCPAEVEEHALRHPCVVDAAAVGLVAADGLIRLGLAVVPTEHAPSSEVLEVDIRNHFERNMSLSKCPRRIRFVESVPRTVTGKLQRFRVRDMFAPG